MPPPSRCQYGNPSAGSDRDQGPYGSWDSVGNLGCVNCEECDRPVAATDRYCGWCGSDLGLPVPAGRPSSAWSATHLIGTSGARTYAQPDPALEPTVRLDPGLEVQLIGRHDDLGHVRCSNEWECWVPITELMALEAWQGTHAAPAGGLATHDAPGSAATDRLDAGTLVQVVERAGDWAEVRCSNGWICWVDGRQLESRV